MLPTKFWLIWLFGFFREDFFRNQPIRNKNCLWWPCLLTNRDEMSNLYRTLSIDASYQVSVHLVKSWQRKFFLEIDQSEKRIACGGHFCKRNEPKWTIFIEDLPYVLPTKFRFIWPSGFRGEDLFRNWPIRNKNCLWWPCLLTDWDEMSNHNRGLSIYASYQVSVHLAKRFQRRRI